MLQRSKRTTHYVNLLPKLIDVAALPWAARLTQLQNVLCSLNCSLELSLQLLQALRGFL
jgi:hypothetical protein